MEARETKQTVNPFEKLIEAKKLAESRKDPLSEVCFLATTQYDKSPHVRAMQLHDLIDGGLFIIINDTSPKWEQLTSSATYEALLYFPSVSVQSRLCGAFFMADSITTEKYWKNKPYKFKSLDYFHSIFYDQSTRQIEKRTFVDEMNHIKETYPDSEELSVPEHVKGIYLVPTEIEIWMDDTVDDIPVRLSYLIKNDEWHESLMVP
jgi:pyridoxine/pyridoxamine 5'-phosphate oxidase